MKKSHYIIFGLISLIFFSGVAGAETILIANNSVTQDAISKEEVQLIFLGKKKKWDNGERIRVAALKSGTVNESFLKEYLNKTPSKFASFWKIAIVSGTGHPPRFFETESDLINYVADKEGAIGYISSTTSHEGVKSLTIE